MNRIYFVLAGLCLAAALVVPPILIHLQSDSDLIYILSQGAMDATQAQETIQAINAANLRLFAIVGIVEVVVVILFALFLWMALKP